MALSKTMVTLIERAERRGRAVKRVREGSVMGNYSPWHNVDVRSTPMIEQWAVTVERTRQDGVNYTNLIVDHYGTQIAHIVVSNGQAKLVDYYGESRSDCDTLNGLCEVFAINRGFTYRPSKDEFKEVV